MTIKNALPSLLKNSTMKKKKNSVGSNESARLFDIKIEKIIYRYFHVHSVHKKKSLLYPYKK